MFKPAATFVIMFGLASPALAQPAAPSQVAPAASAQAKTNLNDKIICERQEEIGTRLGGKKVCKTAAQWAEERQTERNDIEKVQQGVNQSPSR